MFYIGCVTILLAYAIDHSSDTAHFTWPETLIVVTVSCLQETGVFFAIQTAIGLSIYYSDRYMAYYSCYLMQMLDDFVDVTKDEKQIMHLWNSFVRKQRSFLSGWILIISFLFI